jgi:hypothetical protein
MPDSAGWELGRLARATGQLPDAFRDGRRMSILEPGLEGALDRLIEVGLPAHISLRVE